MRETFVRAATAEWREGSQGTMMATLCHREERDASDHHHDPVVSQ